MSRFRLHATLLIAMVPLCLVLSGCKSSSHAAAASPTTATAATATATTAASPAVAAATAPATVAPSSTEATGSSAAPTQASPSATTAAAGSGANPTCPTAAAVTAAVGSPYPTPVSHSGAGLLECVYANDSVNLVMSFAPSASVTATVLKQVVDAQAHAQGVSDSPVSGIGTAAYIFTMNDAATNSTHVATTTIGLIAPNRYVVIVAQLSVPQIEAVARLTISH